MNDQLMNIEKCVAKIEGIQNGNAILVDKGHAVTVKHCVAEKSIKLVFPKLIEGQVVERSAEKLEFSEMDEDELVLLKLKDELPEVEIFFASRSLRPSEKAKIFGYDANYLAEGRWTDIKSVSGIITNPELIHDLAFDLITSRERSFAGLSGSPIVKDGYIIGITSQELVENNNAVTIHGISVKSCINFFNRYDITVKTFPEIGDYLFEPNLSIGEYGPRSNVVSIAGVQKIQSKIKDIYKDKLADIMLMHHRGNYNRAWEEIQKQIIELNGDSFVDNEVKAEYYYRMALWFLEDRNDLRKAQKRYDKAIELKPSLDGSVFCALKKSMTGEGSNPEDLLEPVNTTGKYNVYLQICINTNKIKKAYEKYEELDQIIPIDDTTNYLLSILKILYKEYDSALEHIEKALKADAKVPFYHLVKGIIQYRKVLPEDVCLADDFYPVMFISGLFYMDQGQQQVLREASKEFRKAYQLAVNVENDIQIEAILSSWLNALSLDDSFQNDIMEPLELLRRKNPFNAMVLLFMLHKRMELGHEVTMESLEQQLKKSKNKIGIVIALIEYCFHKNDKKNAKRYLHEYRSLFFNGQFFDYWYEYITRAEENTEKLREYEEEIRKNIEFDEIRKKRLLCLFMQFDPEREQELESKLTDIYNKTGKRIDLMNLISFFKKRKKWQEMLQYADRLLEQYNDVNGSIYKIQSLIGNQEYDTALKNIEAVKEKHIPGIETELLNREIEVYERLGRYSEAIEAGQKLLKKKPTEKIILKLASLYALNGEEEETLRTLLKSEENDLLTVTICQRISVCYLLTNQRSAWNYAKKAVSLSDNQPEIMLWAMNIAYRVGKSDEAGEYLHRIMMGNPDHQLLTVKSIDEVLEIMRESKAEEEKNLELLYNGNLFSHLFIDSYNGRLTYAEFFYLQWNGGEMAPMEFGAHYNHGSTLKLDLKQIALDYSSCLLMHGLGVLISFCENMDRVYVSGNLFGIISDEIRKIPVNQPDIICSKYQLIQKIKNLSVDFVDVKIPADIEGMDAKSRADAINIYTAQYYEAILVSEDDIEGSIKEIDVIFILYREGKITQDIIKKFTSEKVIFQEEKEQILMQENTRILVDLETLMKWDLLYLLPVICERFSVLIENTIVEEIERQYNQIVNKEYICKQLGDLRESLLYLKDRGKIGFLPVDVEKEEFVYSNMLISLLTAAEKRRIPICVDDRVLTSYVNVGNMPIYNTFDVMKILFLSKNIGLEQYSSLWKVALDKNIRYIIPDTNYVFYALKISDVDVKMNMLIESEMLSTARKYVVKALSQDSYLSHNQVSHVLIPEWEYFVFYLQGCSRELIRLVWQSDMEYDKKYLASEWILCHYSQFAFDFSETFDERRKKNSHAIQLADFLIEGLLLFNNEEHEEQYYKWLYGWFGNYLSLNPDIKERTLNYAQEFMVSHFREIEKKGDKTEIVIVKIMFATGIYYMPEEYKTFLLNNQAILRMYNSVYSSISIVFSEKKQIPSKIFNVWEEEVLAKDEKEVLIKTYKNVSYELFWEYIIPGFPGLSISWMEDSELIIRRLFLDKGVRLKHSNRNVRNSEYQYIEPYLEDIDCQVKRHSLLSQSKYEETANEILKVLDLSKKFEYLRLEKGIKSNWLSNELTRSLMLPSMPEFFKHFFDINTESDKEVAGKDDVILSLPLKFDAGECNIEVDNHNPVRLLHKLGTLLYTEAREEKILVVIDNLFSFVNGSNSVYGRLFVIFLHVIWNMFSEMDEYRKEPLENRMMWAYIWTDMMMTSFAKLEDEEAVSVVAYEKLLEENMDFDIDMDGLWTIETEDVLSPQHMNLYKLCVTGTLTICSQYEKRMEHMAHIILKKIASNYTSPAKKCQ